MLTSHGTAARAARAANLEHRQQREHSTGIKELPLRAVVSRHAAPHAVDDGQQEGLDAYLLKCYINALKEGWCVSRTASADEVKRLLLRIDTPSRPSNKA